MQAPQKTVCTKYQNLFSWENINIVINCLLLNMPNEWSIYTVPGPYSEVNAGGEGGGGLLTQNVVSWQIWDNGTMTRRPVFGLWTFFGRFSF